MSSQNSVPKKTAARLPRGFVDRGPAEIAALNEMMRIIREVYERYGFDPVETPMFEYTDALGKFLPDQDRPNAGVFSLQDDDEQWMSLRYDLTAPLARHYAENHQKLPKPYRSYRAGYVFRNEKPGPGRFRQFMQFDADIVGASSVAADAEMCMMMADTMDALGLAGKYVVKVNNRKVLDGVMEAIGLGGEENAGRRLTVLRAIDKFDKFGVEGVRQLLGAGRKDESGDFTKGAGLDEREITMLLYVDLPSLAALTRQRSSDDTVSVHDQTIYIGMNEIKIREDDELTLNHLLEKFGSYNEAREGIDELAKISSLYKKSNYVDGSIRIDPSVVRGLEYYTGPVYEIELTFEVPGEDGKPVRFGSVGGGGRYDGLVSRFLDEPVPATGFSIGVSRLLAALFAIKSPIVMGKAALGPVVVTVMDKDRIADYQAMVATLRKAGIRAELYLGDSGFKAQMKYADRRNAPCAVIQGSDEAAKGEVQIKDLAIGAELAGIAKHDREAYLAKQAEAQFSVPVAGLVEGVRRVLARRAT
jgi:histidyl-tRNA synthetase